MSTPKKLLLVIPTLDQSGAEKQLVLLAVGLPKTLFNVHVCVLTRDGPLSDSLRDNNIPYTVIGKKGKIDPFAWLRLKKLIRSFRPDIVHTWLFAANAYGRKAAIDCNVPVIICGERCVDPWKKYWHDWIDRKLAKKTDFFAVNSGGIRDFYVNKGLDPEKFAVIPNAVVPMLSSPITKEELLSELGIPFDTEEKLPFLIGLVARFWPQKRLKEALFSCHQLFFHDVNAYTILIGDGPERDALVRYRNELGMKRRVIMPGHRTDVSRFMSHFDLFWCTSAYEGQSNSILEAMSVGVPVLASDIPGNRELVVHGKTGILIPEFDGDIGRRQIAFTHETIALFKPDQENRRKEYGLAAIERIRSEFSLEKMLERYMELYLSALKNKNLDK